ncbi:MAG: S41 family peptidase, partial [Bacteroidota bacterium]
YSQFISSAEAEEDIEAFSRILQVESSYFQITDIDLAAHFGEAKSLCYKTDSVSIIELTYVFQWILGKIQDSHASVNYDDFDEEQYAWDRQRFPFPIAPLDGQIAALSKIRETKQYEYLHPEFPYLKAVNSLPIQQFFSEYGFDNTRFPEPARTLRNTRDIRHIGEWYFRKGETLEGPLEIVLTNGSTDTTFLADTYPKNSTWYYPGDLRTLPLRRTMKKDEPFEYSQLIRTIDHEVEYLMIPSMIGYDEYPDFEPFFEAYLKAIDPTKSKGLIVDVRGNSGGSRDLIQTLSKFIVPKDQSPWVANVAYLRMDQQFDEDVPSMSGKQLFVYDSPHFTDEDRRAIDAFMKHFEPQAVYHPTAFSAPYCMVVQHQEDLFLDLPIYILCDAGSFSAASILATVFKGLDNVTICGTTTNGSSGRSRYFYLPNSGIRIKLSTMLSFQRNG